jgi:integrase
MEARSTKSRVHHLLEEILNEYIVAADLQSVNSIGNGSDRTGRALTRYNTWAAIRKRAKATGVLTPVGCHTWRATGITIYPWRTTDGSENAQQMAGHSSVTAMPCFD